MTTVGYKALKNKFGLTYESLILIASVSSQTRYMEDEGTKPRDFPRPDLRPNIGPFPVQENGVYQS